jgi:hypothetical protein
MRKQILGGLATLLAGAGTFAMLARDSAASDHDDGENSSKERSLNLTDHYAFKSGSDLVLSLNFNPRSLPGKDYFMAPGARYELHVGKIANKQDAATGTDDYVFRFEAGVPDANNVQSVKLTVLQMQSGALTEIGNSTGMTTPYAKSKAGTLTTNTTTEGTLTTKWFIGQRADSFDFDVVRFFEVRNFLATRFFGKGGNKGDATATLAPNCRGDHLLAEGPEGADADGVNLFNPPSCAPDFTHGLNVTAIMLTVPIAQLGGTVFDTWSTISVPQVQ